ncbi:hypothetical protein ARZXY2_2948 [Arthrobacter sp. ZXY-2]|nr:hypothetical protein ARZXY2_2948 [Arthrobacter sp. ZXY-2]
MLCQIPREGSTAALGLSAAVELLVRMAFPPSSVYPATLPAECTQC